MEVILKNVRLAFANVYKPKKSENGERYSAAFPIVPKSDNHKSLTAAMSKVATDKWEKKGPAILVKLIEGGDVAFKERAATDDAGEPFAGFEDMFTLNAGQDKKKGQPLLIGSNKIDGAFPILVEDDGVLYSGCWVNVKIDVWAQDNTAERGGKRINAQLKTIQFVRDDESFGGGTKPSAEGFEDLGTAGADDDMV